MGFFDSLIRSSRKAGFGGPRWTPLRTTEPDPDEEEGANLGLGGSLSRHSAPGSPLSIRTIVIRVGFVSIALLFIFIWAGMPGPDPLVTDRSGNKLSCSPKNWADGRWVKKKDPISVKGPEDVLPASGFKGCASSREVTWHLVTDHQELYDWRGRVSSFFWKPSSPTCNPLWEEDYAEAMVTDLVEEGGWLLVGDSVTQEHFFSISCTLYPHVHATPIYKDNEYFDRAWPQNMYLSPASPLISTLKFPTGFDIAKTPLISFRRNDLLYNVTEIETLHNGGQWLPKPGVNSTLFGGEATWTISPSEYIDSLFLAPLPDANYRTLIVNTAGHWSLKLFEGLEKGYPEIFDLFRMVVTNFAYQAGRAMDASKSAGKEREIIVRPYLPGDDNCHTSRVLKGPVTRPLDLKHASYNWGWIPDMNDVFQKAIEDRNHPNVHFVDTAWPGRLRPDAHVPGDCLHLTIGAGVIEGWTQYIHHFLTVHLPAKRKPAGWF